MTLLNKMLSMLPWCKPGTTNKLLPCSTQDGLRQARKQDMAGNYDIDGVSFDGDAIFAGGRLKDSQTYKGR